MISRADFVRVICWLTGALIAGPVEACAGEPVEPEQHEAFTGVEIRRILQHALPPMPASPTNAVADDPDAAALGQRLFFETRFSANERVSCATCHDPARAFTDGRQVAQGLGTLSRHTPSLLNVAYNRWFFWDGRADTLWSQALEPIEHELEYGGSRMRVAMTIAGDNGLRSAYERIFGPLPDLSDPARFPRDARPRPAIPDDPHHVAWQAMDESDRHAVNRIYSNAGKCIEAYERRLLSRNSPFDRFAAGLRDGDRAAMSALTSQARRGLKLFIGEANCRLCHAGPNFSDGEFHNTGVPPLGDAPPTDAGRYDGIRLLQSSEFSSKSVFSDDPSRGAAIPTLTRSAETWGQFKTPSLRNVAETAPYMHQGQFATLRDVLQFYSTRQGAVAVGHHQETILTPLNLTHEQLDDIEAFLRSLSGEPLDAGLLRQPDEPVLEPPAVAR